jgi:Right handed beta helix region
LRQPTASSQILVTNTVVLNNSFAGIDIQSSGSSGTVVGVLDNVKMINDANSGLSVSSSVQTTDVTVSDSVVSNNTTGILGNSAGGSVNIVVRNSTISNNGEGLFVGGAGDSMWVTRSTITANTTGWTIGAGGATLLSYDDNNIVGNVNGDFAPSTIGYK